MKKILTSATFVILLLFSVGANAGEFGTPDEAKALAEKASAFF